MDQPEYLICINCETPCYVFEWKDNQVIEVMCEVCGAEEPEAFTTEEEYEAMVSSG